MNRNEKGITADLKNLDDLARVRQLTCSLIRTDGQVLTSERPAPKLGQ